MTTTQTRQHPRGDYLMRVGTCPTCGPHEVVFGPPDSRITYSTVPDGEGRYTVQAHAEWCPVWTGETPEIPAPCCGAPVTGYTFSHGYVLVVPDVGPDGETVDRVVPDTDEAMDRYWALAPQRRPAPRLDKAVLDPCGHEVEGDAARAVVAAVDGAVRLRLAAEADATLARHADLLAAVEAGGHGVLVARYRDAVRRRSDTAVGLLVAMQTLEGSQP